MSYLNKAKRVAHELDECGLLNSCGGGIIQWKECLRRTAEIIEKALRKSKPRRKVKK